MGRKFFEGEIEASLKCLEPVEVLGSVVSQKTLVGKRSGNKTHFPGGALKGGGGNTTFFDRIKQQQRLRGKKKVLEKENRL